MFTVLARWRTLRLLLVVAVITSLYVSVPAAVGTLLPKAAADPVSGAFALGDGVGGSIDARTGQFSVSAPLVKVVGRGSADLTLKLTWEQARAGASLDRYGFGAGWSIGATFVDPGVTVYPAGGGAYAVDSTFPSGLRNYILNDLVYAATGGTLPARAGVPAPVDYSSTVSYDDGRVDYFDGDGNLAARSDRFGNRTDLTYTQITADQWQPTTIVDAYGLTTSFVYGNDPDTGNAQLTVSAPKRSDGVVSTATVDFTNSDQVQSVTDPVGNAASFAYSPVTGAPRGIQFLDQVTGPYQATTTVTYGQFANASGPALVIAKQLAVTDADGDPLAATQTFTMDPAPGTKHNYAGNPNHLSTTRDALFESADSGYQYSTKISNGASSTRSTYDALHRLVERDIVASSDPADDTDDVLVQTQVMDYSAIVPPTALDPNYAQPLTTTLTSSAVSGPDGFTSSTGTRTTTTTHTWDDHGRPKSSTDALGNTTVHTYDDTYGLETSTVLTGTDGSRRSVTNALTDDKKSYHLSSAAEAKPGDTLSARTEVTYGYDDFGQLSSRVVAWAPGAAPPDNGGGPASSTTTYASTDDPAAVTRTIAVTTADGSTAATTTTTVVDLVSGLPMKTTDALGRVTTKNYDAANRILTVTPPDGMVTTTSYGNADADGPATVTATQADGHVIQTSYDALGRKTTVTDNVRSGAFTSDPTSRTVVTISYSPDGTDVTSIDRANRTQTAEHDALGREVRTISANGVTKTTTYDDVGNTSTARTYADNGSGVTQLTRNAYDNLNRKIASRTSYPVPGSSRPLFRVDPADQISYDGIGRQASMTSGDLVVVPDYAGAGGVPATTTIAPAPTAQVKTAAITTTDTTTLDGNPSLRGRSQPGQPARDGLQTVSDEAGNVTTTVDPLGRATAFTYTKDGRPGTRTSPDGTVTTNTYDLATGRLASVSSQDRAGAKVTTTYTYVPAGKPGAGLVPSVTDASGTITYGYDADRHRTSVTYPDGSATSAVYGDNGWLATATDVTGAVTTYCYNPDGSMSSAIQTRGGTPSCVTNGTSSVAQTTGGTTVASVGYAYDGLGRIRTITRGNGLTTTNTYEPNLMLNSQTTTDKSGQQLEKRAYDYDSHHNLVSKTETTAKPSSCSVVCTAGPTTFGTWTTTYGYDAYDRLTRSAVYSGSNVTGVQPVTQVAYTLDVSGNIMSTTRTTRTTGTRPTVSTQTTVNGLDAAGQLTQQTVGTQSASQSHDLQGRVVTALSGAQTSYRPDGLPASVTTGAVTTSFSYWPDGTRRRATTVDPANGTSTVDLHYGVDGTLVNDTTTKPTGSAASASYLITTGREARSLQPVSTAAGRIAATASAPVTTGAGVGYLLRDRHSSVTAIVDSAGAVTNTYAYSDYGAPALLDGRPGTVVGAAAGADPGRANPLQYSGGGVRTQYTDTGLGTVMTPARFYDPTQGRFTSRDTANVHNRYGGFDANPIMKVDPSGQSPIGDTTIDALYVVVFAISVFLSGGAAAAAWGAVTAAAELTAALVVPAIAQTVATVANAVGVVSDGLRLVDDATSLAGHKHFLNDDMRNDINNVSTVAGSVAGAAGGVASFVSARAATAAAGAAQAAHVTVPIDPVVGNVGGVPDGPPRRRSPLSEDCHARHIRSRERPGAGGAIRGGPLRICPGPRARARATARRVGPRRICPRRICPRRAGHQHVGLRRSGERRPAAGADGRESQARRRRTPRRVASGSRTGHREHQRAAVRASAPIGG